MSRALSCTLACALAACGGEAAGRDASRPDAGADAGLQDSGGALDAGFPTACVIESERELDGQVVIGAFAAPGADCSHALEDARLESGTLDVELVIHYFVGAKVQNGLSEFVVLQSAIVAHRDGEMCVPPGGGPQPVSETIPAEADDVAFLIGIPDTIGTTMMPGPTVVSMAFEALTQTGREVVTPPFTFPLVVCEGCLQVNLGPCDAVSPPFDVPCFVGQDSPVDCCTEPDETVRCPP